MFSELLHSLSTRPGRSPSPVRPLGITSLTALQCFAQPHSVFFLHMNSLMGSHRLKGPLCRFLGLFLCQVPSSLVFCPTNCIFFSLPKSYFYLFSSVRWPMLLSGSSLPCTLLQTVLLEEKFHSFVSFSSLTNHSLGLAIVSMPEKNIFFPSFLLFMIGGHDQFYFFHYARSVTVCVFTRSIYCSHDFEWMSSEVIFVVFLVIFFQQ